MNLPIRSMLGLMVLVVILAACGTAAADPQPSAPVPIAPVPTTTADPSDAPSEAPSEEPDEDRTVEGTITLEEGAIADGPGRSIADALASASNGPDLVNGVIFQDTDGKIYLADSVTDASTAAFGGPILEVLNYPENPAEWDMENADLLGLEEANGIVFREGAQLFGVVATR